MAGGSLGDAQGQWWRQSRTFGRSFCVPCPSGAGEGSVPQGWWSWGEGGTSWGGGVCVWDRVPQPLGFCAPFLLRCRLPEPQPRRPPVLAGWCFVRELGERQPGRGELWRSPDQLGLGPCPINCPSLSKLARLWVTRGCGQDGDSLRVLALLQGSDEETRLFFPGEFGAGEGWPSAHGAGCAHPRLRAGAGLVPALPWGWFPKRPCPSSVRGCLGWDLRGRLPTLRDRPPRSRRHRTRICTSLCKKHASFPPRSDFNVNFNSGTWVVPVSPAGRVPSLGAPGLGCRERCRSGWGCRCSATSCILRNYCSFSFHLFRFPFVPRSFAALPTPLFQPVKPC